MKTIIVLFLLIFTSAKINAQDYLISFAGSGDTSQVGTVIVENLTSGATLTMNGDDILHLTGVVGIRELNIHSGVLQVYPNPFTEQTILTVSAPEKGNAVISIVDISGRTVYQFKTMLSPGTYSYRVSGLSQGMYFIKVSGKNYSNSTKLISQSKFQTRAKIEYISSVRNAKASPLKSTSATIDMPYTEGDLLLYKSISGQYSTIVTDVPTSSKTITFNFILCKDNDGRNYSTVTIGNQTWMAENLTCLPGISPPTVGSAFEPYYYVYAYDGTSVAAAKATTNYSTYGVLYNWPAALTTCPTGWHLPSDTAWTTFENYLIDNGYNYDGTTTGNKIAKSLAASTNWDLSYGTGTVGDLSYPAYRNKIGFSGLPGGYRNANGTFYGIGTNCPWWCSTEGTVSSAWYRSLGYYNTYLNRNYSDKSLGFSVRCLKDETDTAPNLLSLDLIQGLINTALNDSQLDYREGLNQVEYELIDLMRDEGGARSAFGDQADDIFNQINHAKVAAMDDIENQAKALCDTVKNKSLLVALSSKPGTKSEIQHYSIKDPIERMAGALGTLAGTPFLFEKAHRDVDGNIILPKIESEQTNGNATLRSSLQLKMLGSRLEAQVEIIASITEPFAYEERTVGTMSEEICPDALGNLPLKFTFHSGIALKGGGQQLGAEGQATGHVNDEGKLESFEAQTKSSGARQPIQGAGDDWGATNKYFEFTSDFTAGSFSNPKISSFNMDFTRASSQVDLKFIDQITPLLAKMNFLMPMIAFWAAEQQWTNGYCVEIESGGEKSVLVNSETPFTAIVRHKFENTELNVPVIAKLTDGQVSVNPSGIKVVAPANFVYKAPDQKDQKATVNLETISKRGIAKLDVGFKTVEVGWKLIHPGCVGVTILSCNSPFGPWDLSCERPYQGGTQYYTLLIPYSADGKSRVTETVYWTFPNVLNSNITTVYDITINKENESYFINYKPLSRTVTFCYEGEECTTQESEPGNSSKSIIYSANPGECN